MANGDFTVGLTLSGTKASGDSIESFSESFTVSSVADEINREVTVPTSLVTLVTLGAVAAAGLATLNGLIIWNTSASNFVRIGLLDTSAKSVYLKIPAGRFFVLFNDDFDCDDDSGATFGSFNDIDTINAIADSAACVVKVRAF